MLRRACRNAPFPALKSEQFHSAAIMQMPRRNSPAAGAAKTPAGIVGLDESVIKKDIGDDTSSLGHLQLQQQRQTLYYLRLIEHEMPKLVAYRKPFVSPSPSTPLVVRSISYGGEEHPAMVKRVIVAPVSRLPLKSSAAIHKFKLLAGPRWTPQPPPNAGIDHNEAGGEHGYIKISCEDFPKPAMNLKWASDALDRLIAEANDAQDTFADVPLDTRHLEAKTRKARKGDHVYGRKGVRPTLRDFPKEWLPAPKTTPSNSPSAS